MTIVLVRHANRDAAGADALSPAGKARAAVLKGMFADAGVTAIFTSQFARTRQTAAPLAAVTGVPAREISPDLGIARDQMLSGGGLVVVIGHSDSVPELIGALGGPTDITIGEVEFDRIFMVTPRDEVSTLAFRYPGG